MKAAPLMLALVLAVAGRAPAQAADAPLTHVTFVQPLVCICGAPYYAADKLGYFKDEGLEVEIVTVQGTSALLAAVQSGSAQFGITNGPSLLNAVPKGLNLVAFAGMDHGLSSFNMVVAEGYAKAHGIGVNEDYKSVLKKLVGARIGVLAITSTGGLLLNAFAKDLALGDGAFQLIAMTPAGAMAAMAHGEIDAWWQSIPPLGGQLAFRSNAIPKFKDVIGNIAFTTAPYLAQHPDVVAKMARAIARGDNALTDPKTQAKALEATFERLPDLPREAIKGEILKPGVPAANGEMDPAAWALTNQVDVQIGLLDKPLTPDQLGAAFTLKYLPKTRIAP